MNNMGFPAYTKTHFSGFTFEMANEVFKEAFQESQQYNLLNFRLEYNIQNSNSAQQLALYNPNKKYIPNNSAIISEKTIER
jgi:hypothetical protein